MSWLLLSRYTKCYFIKSSGKDISLELVNLEKASLSAISFSAWSRIRAKHLKKKKTSSSCCFLHSLNWFIRDSCIYSYLLDIQWTSQRQGRGRQKEKSKTERDRRREGLCSLSQASQAASESHDNIKSNDLGALSCWPTLQKTSIWQEESKAGNK